MRFFVNMSNKVFIGLLLLTSFLFAEDNSLEQRRQENGGSSPHSTLTPSAVPVLSLEEAEMNNREALATHSHETESYDKKTKDSYLSVSPVAVSVLSIEEAHKANNAAIRFQKQQRIKKYIVDFLLKIGLNSNVLSLLSLLAPLLLFLDMIRVRKRKKEINRKWTIKRRLFVLSSIYFLTFSLLVFVPWSIYFGNSSQFSFIFQDFKNENLLFFSFASVLLAIILLIIPPFVSDYVLGVMAGLGLCVYIQSMFMNRYLGEMNGLEPEWNQHAIWSIINITIWIVVVFLPLLLRKFIPSCWDTILSFLNSAVLLLEILACVSMVISAPDSVWKRNEMYYCDGTNQFQFSKEKNIIVFVFDALGSGFVNYCIESDPQTKDVLKDFIWYVDARSNYMQTFPGLLHELTGSLIQPAKNRAELFNQAWHSSSAKSFYKQVKNAGFDSRLYINDNVLGAKSSYHDYFSNIIRSDIVYNVDKTKLRQCLVQISGFTALPYLLKKYFFYDERINQNIVIQEVLSSSKSNIIPGHNDIFYNQMMSKGITTDSNSPILSFNYTSGAHAPWIIDEKCVQHDTPFNDPLPSIKSCIYLLSAFIQLLKEQKIYDNTAILVCSDHGGFAKSHAQPFDMSLMIKPFNHTNSSVVLDESPAQSIDILPSLLQLACGNDADYSSFEGVPVSDIHQDRTRFVYVIFNHSGIPPFYSEKGGGIFQNNCLSEHVFQDIKSFAYSSSFIRNIPLNVDAKVDKKVLNDYYYSSRTK